MGLLARLLVAGALGCAAATQAQALNGDDDRARVAVPYEDVRIRGSIAVGKPECESGRCRLPLRCRISGYEIAAIRAKVHLREIQIWVMRYRPTRRPSQSLCKPVFFTRPAAGGYTVVYRYMGISYPLAPVLIP